MTTLELLTSLLLRLGFVESPSAGLTVARVVAFALAIILALVAYAVAGDLLVTRAIRAIENARSELASILFERKVLHRLNILASLGVGNSLHLEVT